jgi:hypothetical protein
MEGNRTPQEEVVLVKQDIPNNKDQKHKEQIE